MKKGSLFLITGILLIMGSLGVLLFNQYQIRQSAGQAANLVQIIEPKLPMHASGFPGMFSNPAMPVLEIDDQDFCALVDFPGFGTLLPVSSSWDTRNLSAYPSRFWGSIYDNSMIIGGSGQDGQFDFFDQLNPGAVVSVTDMLGFEYSYTVSRIDRAKSVTYERLCEGGHPLVLFAGNLFSTEYLIVRCDLTN